MRFLRSNTAIRLTVGPFFDKTDGVTPETGITVTSCKLTLMVDDANVPTLVLDTAPTASGGSNDMVHVTGDDAGFYDLELAAANVNYVGRAMLAITDAAVHCPVFHEFMILPANVYDSLVLGTDALDVSAIQFSGQTITAGAGVTMPSSVASPTNITAGTLTTVTTATNVTTVNGLAAGVITAASIASAAFSAAKFAADSGLAPIATGTAQSGTASTIRLAAALTFADSILIGALVYVQSGTGAGQARYISGYTSSTDTADVDVNWTTNPDNTSVYVVYPAGPVSLPSAAAIADQVWDEILSGHAVVGSTGAALSAAGGSGDPWSTALPGAYGAGTAGKIIGDNINATVSSRATQTSVDTIDDFVDTEVSAIKTKTDFLPSATAGAAGGLFIAGSNAATSITTALTANVIGNVTGNLSGSVGSVTGAVGSVTGAVGSVTGAVGSVTGAVGSVTGAVGSVTGNVGGNVTGSIGSLATQAKADVNAEVLDTLVTDTHAEPSAVPAATASLKDKIGWMATLSRNRVTQTATTQLVKADNTTTTVGSSTLSDDGTTFDRGEFS